MAEHDDLNTKIAHLRHMYRDLVEEKMAWIRERERALENRKLKMKKFDELQNYHLALSRKLAGCVDVFLNRAIPGADPSPTPPTNLRRPWD